MTDIPEDILKAAQKIEPGECPANIDDRDYLVSLGLMAGKERYEQAVHLLRILVNEGVPAGGGSGSLMPLYNRLPEMIIHALKKHLPNHVTATWPAGNVKEKVRVETMIGAAYTKGWYDCLSEPRPMRAAMESMRSRYVDSLGFDEAMEALKHAREKMWEYGFSEDDLLPIRNAIARYEEA